MVSFEVSIMTGSGRTIAIMNIAVKNCLLFTIIFNQFQVFRRKSDVIKILVRCNHIAFCISMFYGFLQPGSRLLDIIKRFENTTVLVVGDLIADV